VTTTRSSWTTYLIAAATLAVVTFSWLASNAFAQSKVAWSAEQTVTAVGGDCKTNKCSNNSGCASCVQLTIELRADAWVTRTHCYTTANYPDDYPRHNMHEVPCGEDVSWSVFETPIVLTRSQHVVISTTYHNRSSDRARDVRLAVEWSLTEPRVSEMSQPNMFDFAPSASTPRAISVPRELVDDVLWSIAHEGCDVYVGDVVRPPSELRACYASNQKTPEASTRVEEMSLEQIRDATSLALLRSRDEYQIQQNFNWVMDHEGQRNRFSELLTRKQFAEIRLIYKRFQTRNDKAFNALSAVSDSEITALVNGHGLWEANDHQASSEVSATLVDDIGWTIVDAGCQAFDGENIRRPKELRACYLNVQTKNHNGEALKLVARASPRTLTAATERAVARIKERYHISQILGRFLVNRNELDHFRTLTQRKQFEEARSSYASLQKQNAEARFLLFALADSELSAIVNQYRLDIEIPPDVSTDALNSIAGLLDTQEISINDRTTETALAEIACGGTTAVNIAPDDLRVPPACKALVRLAAARQRLTIGESGIVKGGDTISLPVIPRLGVPTLVAFRSGVSAPTVDTALTSSGVHFAPPQPARLIMPEHGTRLSADTVKSFGDNGLQWYASAIAADKIRTTDVSLTGVIRVGIVDAGVDTAHAKLQPFFWKLPVALPNIPWQKGSIGYDYVNESTDPAEDATPNPDGDLESHGTHVTGLVTARALASWLSTTIGKMNLEEHLRVYSLKVATGYDGTIPDFTLPGQALADSLPNQIHLLNLSLEGPRSPFIRKDIIAHSSETLIILAAGNDQKNLNDPQNLHLNGTFRNDDGSPLDNVIIVAALMDDGTLTPDSNRGDLAVQIAAPGNNIYSTVQGGGFGAITGTSQAAPLVTSTAAILLAEHDAYPSAVKERILATCDWDDALRQQHLIAEGCRLNMAKAIVSKTDIVELTAVKLTQGKWLRGTIKRDQFQLKDGDGNVIDSSAIQRIWFLDGDGNVRVAVQGAGHKTAKLDANKIVIALDSGETCPTSTDPCELPAGEIRDVVFRWSPQP
jgi:subtilase family protein